MVHVLDLYPDFLKMFQQGLHHLKCHKLAILNLVLRLRDVVFVSFCYCTVGAIIAL